MPKALARSPMLVGPVIVVALVMLVAASGASAAVLHRGTHGSAVKRLNTRLAGLSYLPAARVGRRFSSATKHAVIAFQKYAGISVDGLVGPQTRAALRRAGRPHAPKGSGHRVVISLRRQLAFLVNAHDRVVRTLSVSTGRAGYRTPAGVFRIHRRERRSWSYAYHVWLPWAGYFHRGYALHGWRHVPVVPASHGCVRIPLVFAAKVFRFARRDTLVDIR